MTGDLLPIHLTGPQAEMLRQIVRLPQHWWSTNVAAERKALEELVTLRLASAKGEGAGRLFRATEQGVSEVGARDNP